MNDNALLYVLAFLFSLTLTVFIAGLIIPYLKSRAEQPIYAEGPSWHLSKSGTPTMGGISFLISISVTLSLCALYKFLADDTPGAISILICTAYSILNAAVGIIDDITKLKHKENAGLTPRAKLILQIALSILFLLARRFLIGDTTVISILSASLNPGVIYYFLSLIILVGITNCANLTDGVDGLASSVAFAIGISTFYFSFGVSDTASFISLALAAGAVGFLVFNIHPAKVFMGDTGSLCLGALIAALAFEFKNPFIAIVSGGVYVIEGISVILQVLFFKMTKKRLFKMAPIHHHLEKCGWDESKICLAATVVTMLLCSAVLLLCRA